MTRISERETVFCLIYESSFFDISSEELIENAKETREVKITDYIVSTFCGVSENSTAIDEIISSYAKGWKVDRISRVTKALLRLAIYEMKYNDDIPVSVAINEAVELAKKYDGDDAPAYINGILGSVAKALKDKE